MSRLVGKPTMWFPTRPDTNRAAQSQKQARSLKFRIKVEEELYYPSSENKGADQLICAFVFAYADCWFSHDGSYVYNCILLRYLTQYNIFVRQQRDQESTQRFKHKHQGGKESAAHRDVNRSPNVRTSDPVPKFGSKF